MLSKLFTITCLLLSVAYARPSDSDSDSDHSETSDSSGYESMRPNPYGSSNYGNLNGHNTNEFILTYREHGGAVSSPPFVGGNYGVENTGVVIIGYGPNEHHYSFRRNRKRKRPMQNLSSASMSPASSDSDSDSN